MARILLSAFSNVTWTKEKHHDSFVEGFINSLIRCGNDVMSVRCNDFMLHPCSTNLKINIQKSKMINLIEKFNPELIITFNNSFPCEEFVTRTNCPIVLYTADGCDFFSLKGLISEYRDRYIFLNLNESVYAALKQHYPFIKEEQYCDFGYATDFRALNIEQDLNISFLGSIPNYTYSLANYFIKESSNEIKETFFEAFDTFKKDVFSEFKYKLPNFKTETSLETLAIFLLTTKDRFDILSELTDLGISIYGYNSFCLAGLYNYELLRAFNFDLCVTMEQSEKLFNRSKISLNLPNSRATCGFSWRVPDILASNSVLLSPDKKDLKSLLKGYATLPTFSSPIEAKDLAMKLLKDDIWRKELSQASQKMIDDKCRFENKFKHMQSCINISLINNKKENLEIMSSEDCLVTQESVEYCIDLSKTHKVIREVSKTLPYFIAKKIVNKFNNARGL